MERAPRERAADTRHLRVVALAGVVALLLLLPLAAASAGQLFDDTDPADTSERPGTSDAAASGATSGTTGSAAAPSGATRSGTHPSATNSYATNPSVPKPSATSRPEAAAGCGPEHTSPEGVEAQTCVLREGDETWARTYYRNTTGERLAAVLSFMGPAARTVQMHCAVAAHDEPAICETPRERTAGAAARYVAVAEFAAAGDGTVSGAAARPLLRSGSGPV